MNRARTVHLFLQFCCLLLFFQLNSLSISNNGDYTKIYALYFPQFHNDSLNNKLWGEGFTDWDSLRTSSEVNRFGDPILRPHRDTGYYDLMDIGIRRRHGKLAKFYGIDGFIYHHYWFYNLNDTYPPPLSRPLLQMLNDGEPNIPFAFNWATDSWLGSWYGRGKTGELLHAQFFPEETESSFKQLVNDHYNYLKQFFYHFNYIKINRVPIMFVYPRIRPNLAKILFRLSELAREDGFPRPGIHFIGAIHDMSSHQLYTEEEELGFPSPKPNVLKSELFYPFATLPKKQSKIPNKCLSYYSNQQYANDTNLQNKFFENYHRIHYLSTLITFDNTPRRSKEFAQIWNRSYEPYWNSYQSFEIDLKNILYYEKCCQANYLRQKSGKFVMINAWNEWAEGMSLEPSEQHGERYLKIIGNVKELMKSKKCTEYDSIRSFSNQKLRAKQPRPPLPLPLPPADPK